MTRRKTTSAKDTVRTIYDRANFYGFMQIKEKGERRSAAGATDKMKKEEALAWMDKLVEAEEVRNSEFDGIRPCGGTKSIQIYEGLTKLAKIIGEPLGVRDRECTEYNKELVLRYAGYEFIELFKCNDTDV